MIGREGLQDAEPLFLAQDTSEGRVLPELSGSGSPRGEHVKDVCDGSVEKVPPFRQPTIASTMQTIEPRKVVTGLLEHTLRIGYELARGRVSKPQTAGLITGQTVGSSSESFYVSTANTAVPTRRHEREVASIAQVHNMLPRRAQDPCRLTRRKQFVVVRGNDGIDRLRSHARTVSETKHHKHHF